MLGVIIFYTLFPNIPDVVDIWIPVFAYPGFIGGVIFYVLLRLAWLSSRFDELSLPQNTALGAVAGLLVGMLPFILGTPSAKYPLSLLISGVIAYTTVLCTISAIVTTLWFRYNTDNQITRKAITEK